MRLVRFWVNPVGCWVFKHAVCVFVFGLSQYFFECLFIFDRFVLAKRYYTDLFYCVV